MPILRTDSLHSHQLVNTLVKNTMNKANLPLASLLILCLLVKAQDHPQPWNTVACQLLPKSTGKAPRQTTTLTSTDPVFLPTKPSNTKKSPGGLIPKFLPAFPQLKSRKIFLPIPAHLHLPTLPPPHPAQVVNMPSTDVTSNVARSQARAFHHRRRHSNSLFRLRPSTPCLLDTGSIRPRPLFRRFSLNRGCRLGLTRWRGTARL